MSDQDLYFMKEAVKLSRQNLELKHGGPFGALIVMEGNIISRGWNQVLRLNDPTAHAEVMAIRNACKELNDYVIAGATIYCSCEPCPMCLSAIHWARISRIVYGNTHKDAASIGFDDAVIYDQLSKPVHERIISMKQCAHSEARQVFDEWNQMEDKILY